MTIWKAKKAAEREVSDLIKANENHPQGQIVKGGGNLEQKEQGKTIRESYRQALKKKFGGETS